MESDGDGISGSPVSVPNEVAGGTPLTSALGTLATPPALGMFGLDAATNATTPGADINATAGSYELLNSASLTVEGFFRTNEGTATLVSRSTGTKGFILDSANDVTARFFVANTQHSVKGTTPIDLSFGQYTAVAFTYDSTSGVAKIFANGTERGTFTVPGGGPIFVAGDSIGVQVGNAMDGGDSGANAGALIDEVRYSDVALPASQLLAVPEPGALGAAAAAAVALLRRRRRPASR